MLLYSIEKFLWDEKTFAFWLCAYISIQFCTLATFLLVFTIDVKSYWTVMTVLVLKKQISSQLQNVTLSVIFEKKTSKQKSSLLYEYYFLCKYQIQFINLSIYLVCIEQKIYLYLHLMAILGKSSWPVLFPYNTRSLLSYGMLWNKSSLIYAKKS